MALQAPLHEFYTWYDEEQSRMTKGSTPNEPAHFPWISRLWLQMRHYAGISGIDLA